MSISKISFSATSDLITWLRENAVPKYFSAVENSSSTVFNCLDANGNIVFMYNPSNSQENTRIYKSETNYVAISNPVAINNPSYAAICEGGILMDLVSFDNRISLPSTHIAMIITKNNRGITTIIAKSSRDSSGSTKPNRSTSICSVAWGDDISGNPTITFSGSQEYQTQIVPFTTFAKYGEISYTPNAYYMPVGQFYSLDYGTFQLGDKSYITNGYWCVKDAEIPEM